jgi:hypothetical protein
MSNMTMPKIPMDVLKLEKVKKNYGFEAWF